MRQPLLKRGEGDRGGEDRGEENGHEEDSPRRESRRNLVSLEQEERLQHRRPPPPRRGSGPCRQPSGRGHALQLRHGPGGGGLSRDRRLKGQGGLCSRRPPPLSPAGGGAPLFRLRRHRRGGGDPSGADRGHQERRRPRDGPGDRLQPRWNRQDHASARIC